MEDVFCSSSYGEDCSFWLVWRARVTNAWQKSGEICQYMQKESYKMTPGATSTGGFFFFRYKSSHLFEMDRGCFVAIILQSWKMATHDRVLWSISCSWKVSSGFPVKHINEHWKSAVCFGRMPVHDNHSSGWVENGSIPPYSGRSMDDTC